MSAYGTTNDEDAPYSHFPLVLFPLWASDTKKNARVSLKKILFFPLRPPSYSFIHVLIFYSMDPCIFYFYFNWKTPSGYNWRSRIFPHSATHFVYLSTFCAIFFPIYPSLPANIHSMLCFIISFFSSSICHPLYTASAIDDVSHSWLCLPQTRKKNSFYFFFCVWMCCLPCLKIGGKDVYISL